MAQQAKNEDVVPEYPSDLDCPKVVLLWSSLSSNAHQQSAQKKMNDLFMIQKIRFEALDGSQADNKDNRNKFFNISKVRGKYPQIFIYTKDDDIKYIGMDEEIQQLVDAEKFDETFKACKKK